MFGNDDDDGNGGPVYDLIVQRQSDTGVGTWGVAIFNDSQSFAEMSFTTLAPFLRDGDH